MILTEPVVYKASNHKTIEMHYPTWVWRRPVRLPQAGLAIYNFNAMMDADAYSCQKGNERVYIFV
jgi:hypothetical protein